MKQKKALGFKFHEIVQTHPRSYVLEDSDVIGGEDKKKQRKKSANRRPYNLALVVEGAFSDQKNSSSSLSSKKGETKKKASKIFKALIFGDSDFLLNQNFSIPSHRNLALNSISYLLDEGDLLSIRPKQINRVPFKITTQKFNTVVVIGVFLPVLLFWLSAWFWFRRRNA